MRVKVCGNTAIDAALVAVDAGADALGFIMVPDTPRGLTPSRAREIVSRMPRDVDLVGVFADRPPAEVDEVAAEVGFTVVQLDGDESWEDYADFDLPVIKGIRLGGPADAGPAGWPPDSILHVDSLQRGKLGGTGKTFPWEWAADLGEHYRLMVSGGLAADNVRNAVRELRPWGVDASSRLESAPGVKDPGKVRAFVVAARQAAAELKARV
jgi:phosphoribosylanthranilate isomerase